MSIDRMLSGVSISASGMAAERTRMEVIANNLANAHTTRGPDQEAYRRQQVVFRSVMDQENLLHGLGGVQVVGVEGDYSTPLKEMKMKGHQHADENGIVKLPNITPANEMVDMMTAARSYEANLRSLRSFRQMAEQALELLRPS